MALMALQNTWSERAMFLLLFTGDPVRLLYTTAGTLLRKVLFTDPSGGNSDISWAARWESCNVMYALTPFGPTGIHTLHSSAGIGFHHDSPIPAHHPSALAQGGRRPFPASFGGGEWARIVYATCRRPRTVLIHLAEFRDCAQGQLPGTVDVRS